MMKNNASVRRTHFTHTFGQVFTARWWAENRRVKRDSLKMALTCAETR